MQTNKPSVKLENWEVVQSPGIAAYQALQPGNLLAGRAFGHQRIQTGSFVFTSPIVQVDAENRIVETSNTEYRLGEASSEYKSWRQERRNSTVA